jgi:hypothetical protein
LSRLLMSCYFGFFVVLFILGFIEKPLPVPDSISSPVLTHSAATPKGAVADAEKKG